MAYLLCMRASSIHTYLWVEPAKWLYLINVHLIFIHFHFVCLRFVCKISQRIDFFSCFDRCCLNFIELCVWKIHSVDLILLFDHFSDRVLLFPRRFRALLKFPPKYSRNNHHAD